MRNSAQRISLFFIRIWYSLLYCQPTNVITCQFNCDVFQPNSSRLTICINFDVMIEFVFVHALTNINSLLSNKDFTVVLCHEQGMCAIARISNEHF